MEQNQEKDQEHGEWYYFKKICRDVVVGVCLLAILALWSDINRWIDDALRDVYYRLFF